MRTTITINDNLLLKLKQHALQQNETVSSLVEEAVIQQLLEDFQDIETAAARANEPTYSFDELVKELQAEGLI